MWARRSTASRSKARSKGCLAQALGYALLEHFQVRDGKILTPYFSSYLLPTVLDMPTEIVPVIMELADPNGPYGARGMSRDAARAVGPRNRRRHPRRDRRLADPAANDARARAGGAGSEVTTFNAKAQARATPLPNDDGYMLRVQTQILRVDASKLHTSSSGLRTPRPPRLSTCV